MVKTPFSIFLVDVNFDKSIVRTQFESFTQVMNEFRPKKTQYNEFVESGLENWILMSWTTNKVDSDDKKRKIDWFKLEEIILDTVREDQFLYISLKFDYKYNF